MGTPTAIAIMAQSRVPMSIAAIPKFASAIFPFSSVTTSHFELVKNEVFSSVNMWTPLIDKKRKIKPKMTSEAIPPAVTIARNTLSDRRGSVVISRGDGIVVVATGASLSGEVIRKQFYGEWKVNER